MIASLVQTDWLDGADGPARYSAVRAGDAANRGVCRLKLKKA